MDRVKKTITLPIDVVRWADDVIKEGRYAGIRSFSSFVEYLLKKEMEYIKNKR